MNDLVREQPQQVNEKKGVAIFQLQDTLFSIKSNVLIKDYMFSQIPQGIRLLRSCLDIDHFAVIISVEDESMRGHLSGLISSLTGMREGADFVIHLFTEGHIISEESVSDHYNSVISTWVGYCAGQKRKVTVGVASNEEVINMFEKHEIKTVFCDVNKTEVEEFCLVTNQTPEVEINKSEDKPKRHSKNKSPDWQSDKIFDGDPAIEQAIQFPEYFKQIPKNWEFADIYRIDELFPIHLPGASRLYHARKKLMIPGVRTGGKSAYKDIQEAVATLQGWLRDHAPRGEFEG